jgi:lipid II:glycine glycyltransferase (peptidoglycan interpeptide bridge formation enzyme)
VAAEVKLRHDADPNWLLSSSGFRVHEIDDWILDLNHGFTHVWEHRFRSSVRRAVRKAERSGLEIEVDRTGRLFDSFYALHQRSVVRWAAMQHAPAWFTRARLAAEVAPARAKLIAESFGPDFAIWLARLAGAPVAAIVIVRADGHAKYLWGAMDKDAAGPARASDLLHTLAIEEACREGFRHYDLGGASVGSSLGAYKEKFGATLVRRHTLRVEHIPIQRAMELPRAAVKKLIGFKDNL